MALKCFYCGKDLQPLTRRMRKKGFTNANSDTLDHIYPINLRIPRKRDRNDPLNKVRACSGCNSTKGDIHPLSWLVLIDYEVGAQALSFRLTELGEDPTFIFTALCRREERLTR